MIRAYLLAGGLGVRLRSRLGALPKALAPFRDATLLEAQLEWLAACGVNEVVLALGVRAQPVIDRVRVRGADAIPRVSWTVDPVPLGTGGALALAARGEDRTFLAVHGDILAEIELVALLEAHRARGSELTAAVFREGEGPAAALDSDGRLRAVGAEAAGALGTGVLGGVYLCEPSFLGAVPHGRPSDLEEEVLPAALAEGRVLHGVAVRGRCFDAGTPEGLDRAAREWSGGAGA